MMGHGQDFLRVIDAKIRVRNILKHPFYQDWKMGKLTRSSLQEYAKQYYAHVEAFPQYLSAVHSQVDDASDRQLLLQNLLDEEHGPKNHPRLWRQFARDLGVTERELLKTAALGTTSAFVDHFKSVTRDGSVAEGLAALYTYESQIPEVSEEKIRGLKKFYNVKSRQGLEYFRVHMKADVEHSRAERKLIKKYAADKKTQAQVLAVVDQTLDAYWGLLGGIQQAFK